MCIYIYIHISLGVCVCIYIGTAMKLGDRVPSPKRNKSLAEYSHVQCSMVTIGILTCKCCNLSLRVGANKHIVQKHRIT